MKKQINRPETKDRAKEFQQWHRTLGRRLLASDVDLVEWRFIDGELVPVGVLEITLADCEPSQSYLDAIICRYEKKTYRAAQRVMWPRRLGARHGLFATPRVVTISGSTT